MTQIKRIRADFKKYPRKSAHPVKSAYLFGHHRKSKWPPRLNVVLPLDSIGFILPYLHCTCHFKEIETVQLFLCNKGYVIGKKHLELAKYDFGQLPE